MTYKSEDSGDVKKLSKLTVPKEVHLKLDAPVMCLVNISAEIVNGLCGSVVGLGTGEISVYFPSIDKTKNFTKYTFTVFDKEKGRDVACRSQIPFRLAFAHTVHKSQGLTIPHLIVDCKHMTNPGQIGVAIGRATTLSHLQVLNFKSTLVKKHNRSVYEFYERPILPPCNDFSCCKEIITSDTDNTENVQEVISEIDEYVSDDEQEELVQLEIAEGVLQQQEIIDNPCPDDINLKECISRLKYDQPMTTNKQKLNTVIDTININSVKVFADIIWNKLSQMYTVPESEPENKHITAFYKAVTMFLQDNSYRDHVKRMFNTVSLEDSHLRCAYGLVESLRGTIIQKHSEEHFIKAREDAQRKTKQVKQSKGSISKIRYIGGWCIATLKYKKKMYVKSNLFKKSKEKDVDSVNKKVKCLELLTVDEETLLANTTDPDSLHEIQRKQNFRGGLTHITDEAIKFFVKLDTKVQQLESKENMRIYTTTFYQFILNELLNDEALVKMWMDLFEDQEEISLAESKTLISDLFCDVARKYLKMSSSQFRSDYKRELKIEKEEAHRKSIRMRKEKQEQKKAFSFEFLVQDKSAQKIKSHLRLQSELSDSKDFLLLFNKDQLLRLCDAYDLKAPKRNTKDQLADLLMQNVPTSCGMVNASKLDPTPTTEIQAVFQYWYVAVFLKTFFHHVADGIHWKIFATVFLRFIAGECHGIVNIVVCSSLIMPYYGTFIILSFMT